MKLNSTSSVYPALSRISLLSRSYALKFLFIAFIGIHIPLIGIILYLLFGPSHLQPLPIFLIVLVLTLLATAATLYMLNGLLTPLMKSKKALENYLEKRMLPNLPQHHSDEAGVLMQKVQQTIMALNNMLEEKQDLASLLSHDLKQPLSAIGASAEALAASTDVTHTHKFAANINKLVKEQFTLLEDVLELLKYDAIINNEEHQTTLPIESIIEDVVTTANVQAGFKNISIQTNFDYDGLIKVNMDLFRQAIKNILHNAVKFSYIDSTIYLNVLSKNGHIKISITDSGKGFNPEVKQKLFQRFTKEGQIGTNNEPSTGIGLHLCKKIIELHNGFVDAHSNGPDTGATFTISLPALIA